MASPLDFTDDEAESDPRLQVPLDAAAVVEGMPEIRSAERGVIFVWVTDYRADGAYAYMYWQQPSTVFEIRGLDVR